jgi:PAS domain S-box-containing protein
MTDPSPASKEAWHFQPEWCRVTLASIGDAVITTDTAGRVTFLNPVAEALTGWALSEAQGQALETVFRIVNEEGRRTAESPATRALREGVIVGLANHTLLIARDGTERSIDDSAAPIRDDQGTVAGVVLVFRDISDRRRLEREIADARAYAENIVATVREPLVVVDAELRVRSASRSFYRTFHVTPEETEGRYLYDLGNGQWDIPRLRALLEEIRPQNGHFDDFEVEHTFPTIGRRTMLLNARRIHRPGNHTELILLAIEDITERKQAEAAVRAQREWSRVTLSSIGDAVIVTDAQGRVTFLNPVAQDLTGWQQEALQKELPEVFRIVHEATRRAVESPVSRVLREGTVVGLASRNTVLIRKDGREVPVDDSSAPIRDERGHIAGVVLVFRDTSELRQARAALEASEVRYRRLFETAQDAILILDAGTGHVMDANPFVADLLGYSHAELVGKELWQIGLFRDIAASRTAFRELQEKGYIRYEDLPLETKQGARVNVEFVSNVYAVNDHQVIQCNIRDITDRKRAEEALKEADHRKDEFLAMLAHELRNPLAPIRTAAQVLRLKGPAEPHLQLARDVIERQVQQLTRLVDDLLDLSRISRGKLNVQLEPVDLATVITRAVEISRPLIDARKHHLEVSLPGQAVQVEGDPARLAQVVSNLLNNAAKYTEEGGRIWLTVEPASERRRRPREVLLRVRDTGVGIAADMLPSIFEMFTQVQGSVSRSEGGLGVGLTLVRSLVELHGGSVTALSEGLGQGSEFVVRLPLLQKPPPPAPAAREQPTRTRKAPPRRILVVDDNTDAAETLALLLRLIGHEVRTAYDAPTALDVARAQPPDVVLLDIGLPGTDGLEVARRLRQNLGLNDALLVALTGYGQDEDRRRSHKAGFNAHLVKPVDLDALQELLSRPQAATPGQPGAEEG